MRTKEVACPYHNFVISEMVFSNSPQTWIFLKSLFTYMTVKKITFKIKQLRTHHLYLIITIKLLQRADPQKSSRAHIFPKSKIHGNVLPLFLTLI